MLKTPTNKYLLKSSQHTRTLKKKEKNGKQKERKGRMKEK